MLEEATVNVCKNFVVNNGRTGNFASLISVFLIRADELKVSAQCHEWVGNNINLLKNADIIKYNKHDCHEVNIKINPMCINNT